MELRAFWDQFRRNGPDESRHGDGFGHGCMYWMNLMEAGMVMIIIRTGVGEVNVGSMLLLQSAKLGRVYCS